MINNSKKTSHFYSQRGFTLIEILITIAIIATLAGISSVAYSRFSHSGKKLQTQQQMRTIIQAANDFKNDIGCYPYVGEAGTTPPVFIATVSQSGNLPKVNNSAISLSADNGIHFINALLGVEGFRQRNTSGKEYLVGIPMAVNNKAGLVPINSSTQRSYQDSWKRAVYIQMENALSPNAKFNIRHSEIFALTPYSKPLIGQEHQILMISAGPNGSVDNTQSNDDVITW